ncbi:hypothetical protein [Natribacillus halophilus]|uniref:Uncharacterized protein n=1 Tax=Natribacillus halophilus TaxID=549003 RepID=A0A1G8RJS4_9BACI|nr:hypothetical protein [Natribacillus halophilus]SDJ17247.1 hypothetical protein SAMN04488123_11844 [Natribacillus halophilus]
MLDLPQISQVSANLLEHARHKGVSELELQRAIQEENVSFLNEVSDELFSYDEVFTHAREQGEELERALLEGYNIKFITKDGLKTWLKQKFGFEEGRDYREEEGQIKGLVLDKDERQMLESSLAGNWTIETVDNDENQNEQRVILHLNVWFD